MNDLELIKKTYGEKMMHLCRNLFSTILEKPGILYMLLIENFYPSKFLAEDLIRFDKLGDFKNYIFNLVSAEKTEKKVINNKTPKELLNEVGYDLFECKSENDIRKFKKYYASGEALCTFNGGRLKNCYVFFAVKKNVNDIKRENFKNPERQDEYGTSVISIQFTKEEKSFISIKNRYNHTVNNPDATFSNNLDNIVDGLTKSFEEFYHLDLSANKKNSFEMPGYIRAKDGKFYKYNYEINNIYYCPDNIIIENFEAKQDYQEKERYLIIDYFIIDLQNEKVILYDKNICDSFIKHIKDINKINIIKNKKNKNKSIEIVFNDETYLTLEVDVYNRIISYENKFITKIEDYFFLYNIFLEKISLPEVVEIGDEFLFMNNLLTVLELPQVQQIGNGFLKLNKKLEKIYLPKVLKIGNNFLLENNALIDVKLPTVKEIGWSFMFYNKSLKKISFPKLEKVKPDFLVKNKKIISFECSKSVEDALIRGSRDAIRRGIIIKVGKHFLNLSKKIKAHLNTRLINRKNLN